MKTNLNIIPNSEHLCTYVERSYVEENWLNASKPTQRKKLKVAEVTIIYIIDSQNLFNPRRVVLSIHAQITIVPLQH